MTKLWLISQEANDGYDTYSNAVVVAHDEVSAKDIHPSGRREWIHLTWVKRGSEHIHVKYIGEAAEELLPGTVVCASFRAG
jgi:hypothetical protein